MNRLLSILILFAFGCKPDPKIPAWDVEALAPLVHSRLTIGDILPDSNMQVSASGLISLIYQNELLQLQPSQIMEPLNVEFENTISLQDINLKDHLIKDAISLGYLASGGNPFGQFIIYNNGQKALIPPFTTTTKKNFIIDATNIFQTLNLISGTLTLKLYNDLPVALTDLQFEFANKNSGTIIINKTIDTLSPQETHTEIVSLAGTTIEGELLTSLKSFGTPGSGTDSLVIDTSRKIFITVALEDLVPASATAIFPDQNLTNDTTDTKIEAAPAQLTSIRIKQGSIFLDASSTIEDKISLSYHIPNAYKNNVPLAFDEVIDPAPASGFSTKYLTKDLSGYEVNLQGKPLDINVYNTFYTITQGSIDSSGNLINLSLDDSVFLKTGISGLMADRGFGYLGKDTLSSEQYNVVDIFQNLKQANFDLDDAKLGIGVENYIGAPISVQLDNFFSVGNTGSLALNYAGLGKPEMVPAATMGITGIPLAGRFDTLLDKNNSNLHELIELKPDSFLTGLTAYLNGNTTTPIYDQFIYTDYGVNLFLFLEVPLHLSGSNILLNDTAAFDYYDLDKNGRLQQGVLKIIAENNFPLEANVKILLLNSEGDEIGDLISADKILAAGIDNDGRAINVKRSLVHYNLNAHNLPLLKNTESLVFQVTLNTFLPPQKVKLHENNYMDLTLSGDLTIRTK